ncbi:hypothetical protein JCM8097_004569 [Rhodosporidiobolus ruineniae]
MLALLALASLSSSLTLALPAPTPTATASLALAARVYEPGVSVPYFPPDMPSCVACEPQWSGINSCAMAAPAFQNWQNVRSFLSLHGERSIDEPLASLSRAQMLYNPLSFVSAIKCGCTDTFNSAYPQCVDCFVQTNQCEQYLGVPSEQNASSILDGLRNVCGFGSALLGGVATSQASAGISYTYTAEPSQGYPTTTSIGVGGMDYGSAEGATSGAAPFALASFAVVLGGVVGLAAVWA